MTRYQELPWWVKIVGQCATKRWLCVTNFPRLLLDELAGFSTRVHFGSVVPNNKEIRDGRYFPKFPGDYRFNQLQAALITQLLILAVTRVQRTQHSGNSSPSTHLKQPPLYRRIVWTEHRFHRTTAVAQLSQFKPDWQPGSSLKLISHQDSSIVVPDSEIHKGYLLPSWLSVFYRQTDGWTLNCLLCFLPCSVNI